MPFTPFNQTQQRNFIPFDEVAKTSAPEAKKDGFLKSLITDPLKTLVVKPGVRAGQAIGQGLLELGALTGNEKLKAARDKGREMIGQDVRFPGAGGINVEGQKAFGEGGAKQIAGDALKTASYLYGANEAVPLKNTFGALVRQSARIGAVGGASYGAGEALQNNGSFGDVATSAILGGGAGLVTGLALPVAGYGLSKAFKGAKYAFTPKSQKITQAVNELEDTYKDINQGWMQTRKASAKAERVTVMKNKSGTVGRAPERVLAESGIIPNHEGTQFKTRAQAAQLRESVRPLSEANRNALREAQQATPPVSLDQFERDAIARARSAKNVAAGTADDLEKGVRRAMSGYRKNYGTQVNLTTLDDIKSGRWGQTGFSLTKDDKLATDVNYIIGKTAQETIEETAAKAGAKDVAQLNREIGDMLEAATFLDNLDGRAVAYGKMGTHMLRLSGAIIGSKGGPIGSFAGAYGGDVLADILRSTRIAGPVKRLILKDLEKTNPAAYQSTLQWLKQQGLERELRLALPPASHIPMGPKSPGESGIKIVPAPKGPTGFDPKTGRFKTTFLSQSDQGSLPSFKNEYNAHINNATPKASMPESVPSATTLGKRKGGQAGFISPQLLKTGGGAAVGSTAGFERDQNGNIKYDVKKGLAGAAAGGILANAGKAGLSIEKINPEAIAKKIDGRDLGLIRDYINKGDINSFNRAQPMIEAMGLQSMDEPTLKRFLGEVLDLSTKKLPVKSAENRYIKGESGRFAGSTAFGRPNLQSGSISKGAMATAGAIGTAATVFGRKGNTATYTRNETKQDNSVPVETNPHYKKIKDEIAFRESGVADNPYDATHSNATGTTDYGKYQVNETTLKTYAPKFLGRPVDPKEFLASPALQEKFMDEAIKHLQSLGAKSMDALLVLWHRGWGDVSSKRVQELKNDPEVKRYLGNKPIKSNFGKP